MALSTSFHGSEPPFRSLTLHGLHGPVPVPGARAFFSGRVVDDYNNIVIMLL